MNIHKSAEDYLEMILRLQESQEYVRAVDISIGLSVTKPSVSVAMRNLKDSGYKMELSEQPETGTRNRERP